MSNLNALYETVCYFVHPGCSHGIEKCIIDEYILDKCFMFYPCCLNCCNLENKKQFSECKTRVINKSEINYYKMLKWSILLI
jgi:hypothetical protein